MHFTKFRIRSLRIHSHSRYFASQAIQDQLELINAVRNSHKCNNVTETVISKLGRNLHLKEDHPLSLTKRMCVVKCNICENLTLF